MISAFRTANELTINQAPNSLNICTLSLTVSVSHVNKFIRNDVVTIVRGSWGGHRQAVDIKAASDNRKEGDELQEEQNRRWFNKE